MLASVGMSTVQSPVASPRANAFAERFVRSVPEDYLNHLLVVSRRHPQAVLAEWVRHYNEVRPHRGSRLNSRSPRGAVRHAWVIRRHILGGLVHKYERAA